MNFILDHLVIASAYAQLPLPKQVETVSGGSKILDFICNTVLSWLFTAAILFSVLMVLIAAFRYMTSGGDSTKVKLASNTLVFAAIGIAVAILARTLPVLVGSIVTRDLNLDPCPAGGTTGSSTTMIATPGSSFLL